MGVIKRHPVFFWGMSITLVFLWLAYARVEFIDALELKLYDLRMRMLETPYAKSDIVLVDIDDDSLEKIGRWPWPRSVIADGLAKISAGNPQFIGLNILFLEPEENSGLTLLKKLETIFREQVLDPDNPKEKEFQDLLSQLQTRMDHDVALAEAVRAAGNVVLPMVFIRSLAVDEAGLEPDAEAAKYSMPALNQQQAIYPRAQELLLPLAGLQEAAVGIGHLSLIPDADGVARRARLVYGYRGLFLPSYALTLAASYLHTPLSQVTVNLGASIDIGRLSIPLTVTSEFLVGFKGARDSFTRYSYFDVISDKIKGTPFKNKIVLLGVSASGIGQPLSTPTDPLMSRSEYSANTLWSILNKRFIVEPDWGALAELGCVLFVGLLITFVFARLKAVLAGVLFLVCCGAITGGAVYLFVAKGLWVTSTYPLLELVVGYIGVVSLKYFVTEVGKEKIEEESAESNRMLGLSFQEQGRLEMAFDKFRRCPVDKGMKDILYGLAQDFERKRQFHKAVGVYEHIEAHDPNFKDVSQRKSRLMQVGETVVLGADSADPLLGTSTDTRPTLGRYEILKQLGKGAMGIVYLGRDPRINRTTAIKTFNFPTELDEEETAKLKRRFFQEAESAGTLSHPNIVTIYDAGEEHDLAYIAMEFLEGHDLQRYVKEESLLSLQRVLAYGADIADALDYAHQKGIVHRDIKPANIMLLHSGVIKITDFGIARITATSQTQTGVVKGTPHYMSPEQISGEKVDGRSDIFSLGVMLYQLISGETPFKGENMAALMNQILHVEPKNLRTLNPDVPEPLVRVLAKSMEKDRDNRYKRAASMAKDLRRILDMLGGAAFDRAEV